ncbi:hypothetical protein VE02_08248 [Pseudogymnoascus sp. 03VT05]|nr:hypothetical protein VE02_08248 [Pseudogymnoascus sp. 03VT05]
MTLLKRDSRTVASGQPAGTNVQNGHANGGRPDSVAQAPPTYTPTNSNPTNLTEAEMMNAAAENGNAAAGAQPDIAWAFSNLTIKENDNSFPTPEETLGHLKLLEAFYALKDEVAYTDGAFGLYDCRAPGTDESVAGDQPATIKRLEALAQIREKRWALYVARATDRFESWWTKVLTPMDKAFCNSLGPSLGVSRLRVSDITSVGWVKFVDEPSFTKSPNDPTKGWKHLKWVWTRDMLPPLDVLMVWHSFMLNPRNYLEDCMRFGLRDTWYAGMPWKAVNDSINDSFDYEVTDAAKTKWTSSTSRPWSNLDEASVKSLRCPRCSTFQSIPWTTASMEESARHNWDMKYVGHGYAEADLLEKCAVCNLNITHDNLRVAKFKRDAEDLLRSDYPMGGTIVPGKGGTPLKLRLHETAYSPQTFPNRLIKEHLRTQVLDLNKEDYGSQLCRTGNLIYVRTLIEASIKDKAVIARINGYKISGKMYPDERLAVRHMMSRYWTNHSLFSMELSSAVIRQGSFVDKMHKIDWLHSPTALSTMERLLIKYERFFRIMASNPNQTAVPTLDVDLAWHTHQLSPREYYNFSIRMTLDRFIDHDDKIDEEKLSEGFEWTSKEYERTYGTVYSECTCWYCEAIRAKHVSSASSIFKKTSKHDKISDEFYNSGAAKFCPPSNSAHISAHNAVPVVNSDPMNKRVAERLAAARKKQLDEAYAKACKRAIKRGRPVPQKEQFVANHYGMAYASPYPYGMMYMTPFMYPFGLYYMPLGVGVYGACASGTYNSGNAPWPQISFNLHQHSYEPRTFLGVGFSTHTTYPETAGTFGIHTLAESRAEKPRNRTQDREADKHNHASSSTNTNSQDEAAKSGASPELQILLLHRVKTSSSFASAHVFPGGNLSSQDGSIPAPSSPERHVDSPVYRLGAIRECFEESGILLARHRDGGGMLEVPDAERERARRAIHSGEEKFSEWVKKMGGVVDADALLPFTRWITPTSVPRRFTTQMYVYFWPLLGAGQDAKIPIGGDAMIPTPTSDGGLEHTAAVFQSCATWLEQARRNEIIMFPPQFYLIWLLGKFFEEGKGGAMELRTQREKVKEFLKGSGANGVPWADKVMSPVPLGMFEGRAVLNLDHPGPELKGSGRKGESGHVVQVRFSKEGPRDVEVRDAVEMKRLMGGPKGKL